MSGGATGRGYEVTQRDGLAEIRLACGKANALNPRSLDALAAAFEAVRGSGAAGVVLTGYEGFFSAGLDLVLLYGLDPAAMDAFMQTFDRVMLEVFAFPRPVVAALNGHAVAGGCILALACDARVALEGPIKIGLNEVRLGVPFPASALEIARHGLPARSLEEVLYGGELYAPADARSRGLVDRVTGDPLAEARGLCARLAGQPRGAFAAIKAALKAPALARARDTLDPLRRAFVEAWYSPDARDRIGAARAPLLR
jgi:Delta3-Delta2-enoyl-CoA isomerase